MGSTTLNIRPAKQAGLPAIMAILADDPLSATRDYTGSADEIAPRPRTLLG